MEDAPDFNMLTSSNNIIIITCNGHLSDIFFVGTIKETDLLSLVIVIEIHISLINNTQILIVGRNIQISDMEVLDGELEVSKMLVCYFEGLGFVIDCMDLLFD